MATQAELVADMRYICESVMHYDREIEKCANDPKKMASHCTAQGDTLDRLYLDMVTRARLGLKKVREEEDNGDQG